MTPRFIIIGVQRGGTTSLYNYLSGHPAIRPASVKEVHFFDLHFENGPDWYRAQFPEDAPGNRSAIAGEASPYYIYHPLAPRRIAALLPEVKLLVLLRNPIDRAYSQYNHVLRRGLELLSFEQALAGETERLAGETERIINQPGYQSVNHQRLSYRSRGLYADQLEAWFQLFPREQFWIESSELLFQNPGLVLSRALSFLGLPEWAPAEYLVFNEGRYPPMEAATRAQLADYFAPHNRQLYQLLGRDFEWA
ncbi:MAG: sulfotransferase domain-containing protein [Anaerolineae bacterium]